MDAALARELNRHRVDTLAVSGTETEVRVLATVLGGVTIASRLPQTPFARRPTALVDAMLETHHNRFGMQVETASVDEILKGHLT
jgi:hypothetical protein